MAKRNYDLALQVEPDAYLAVYLALLSLGHGFFWEWYEKGGFTQMFGMEWDTLLIIVLLIVLIILLTIKHTRQQRV